eukprot:7378681-Prymnesium_polylepis.1
MFFICKQPHGMERYTLSRDSHGATLCATHTHSRPPPRRPVTHTHETPGPPPARRPPSPHHGVKKVRSAFSRASIAPDATVLVAPRRQNSFSHRSFDGDGVLGRRTDAAD